MSGDLDGEVTRESAGVLDEDNPCPVAQEVGQHGREARTVGHWICPAHCGVVELLDNLQAVRFGISTHGLLLARQRVLVRADIGCGAGAVVGDAGGGATGSQVWVPILKVVAESYT